MICWKEPFLIKMIVNGLLLKKYVFRYWRFNPVLFSCDSVFVCV